MTKHYFVPPRPERINYDESRVPPFTLPDPLVCSDGTRVTSAALFESRRRDELLELFRREVYGRAPVHTGVKVSEVSRDTSALAGLGTRVELDIAVGLADDKELRLALLLFVPNRRGPHPTFLGLNLAGNHTVHPDPAIRLAQGWVPYLPEIGSSDHVAVHASRGMHSRRWPVELIVSRGYALATLYAGDIEPDYPDGAHGSVVRNAAGAAGVAAGEAPGSIATWAFGLSRALDALSTIEAVAARSVALIGHSRLGKAALWAAAQDPRFALVLANSSGRGGAALSRRGFGESLPDLNQRFPHWFCGNFRRYEGREAELPVDQHELIALLAPRPVQLGNAELDLWCDPRGELLACVAATPVYELFGARGLEVEPEPVPLGVSLGDRLGYHRRPGGHDLTKVDWWHYLAFADRHA